MEIGTSERTDPMLGIERERQIRTRENLVRLLTSVWSRRRSIAAITGIVAVGAVVISLVLPKWYTSTARVLLPESGGAGALGAMIAEVAPTAITQLLGTGGGDYIRYRAILSSRSTMEAVISEFDLITVYDVADSDAPTEDAIEMLQSNVDFPIDDEFQYLSVSVLDRDPTRAAAMANFFVGELNRRNSELLAQNATAYRAYLSATLDDSQAQLDSARVSLQGFQEKNGIVDLPTQAESFLESMASLRTDVLRSEIEYEVLQRQYGEGNPQTEAAGSAYRAANSMYTRAFGGGERLLPIAQDSLPAVSRAYSELLQDVLIQTEIVRFVRPLYEQARFDEQREKIAVQILDAAQPPARKSKPRRKLLVILATLSGFLLSLLWAIGTDYYRRDVKPMMVRLDEATKR